MIIAAGCEWLLKSSMKARLPKGAKATFRKRFSRRQIVCLLYAALLREAGAAAGGNRHHVLAYLSSVLWGAPKRQGATSARQRPAPASREQRAHEAMPICASTLAMSALGSSHISRVQRGAQALKGRMILSARVDIPFAAAQPDRRGGVHVSRATARRPHNSGPLTTRPGAPQCIPIPR